MGPLTDSTYNLSNYTVKTKRVQRYFMYPHDLDTSTQVMLRNVYGIDMRDVDSVHVLYC